MSAVFVIIAYICGFSAAVMLKLERDGWVGAFTGLAVLIAIAAAVLG